MHISIRHLMQTIWSIVFVKNAFKLHLMFRSMILSTSDVPMMRNQLTTILSNMVLLKNLVTRQFTIKILSTIPIPYRPRSGFRGRTCHNSWWRLNWSHKPRVRHPIVLMIWFQRISWNLKQPLKQLIPFFVVHLKSTHFHQKLWRELSSDLLSVLDFWSLR